MALPSGGSLSFNEIGIELQRAAGSILDIKDAELGVYVPLNPYSIYRPDGITPCSVSEWYNYNHTYQPNFPAFQLTLSGSATARTNENFNLGFTIRNIGQASTNGSVVTLKFQLLPNEIFVSANAPGWTINSASSLITATRSDVLGINSNYNDCTFTLKIINCATGAYYNGGTVEGGGTQSVVPSNTFTTDISLWSSTQSLSRSIQKNNCGAYCVGTYVTVTSPSFTRTDCDSAQGARQKALDDANAWLDANGQNIANTNGSCNCTYPRFTLSKVLDSALPIYVGGGLQWKITLNVFDATTLGQVVVSDVIDGNFTENNSAGSNPFNLTRSGNTIFFTTNNSLPANTSYDFFIAITANSAGSFYNEANVSGGSANNATASATVFISNQPQAYISVSHTSNHTNVFKSSSGTTGVHLGDNPTVRFTCTFSVTNSSTSVNDNYVVFPSFPNTSMYIVDKGSYSGYFAWSDSWNGFVSSYGIPIGNYSFWIDIKWNDFIGVRGDQFRFECFRNYFNYQTGSFGQFNVIGKIRFNYKIFYNDNATQDYSVSGFYQLNKYANYNYETSAPFRNAVNSLTVLVEEYYIGNGLYRSGFQGRSLEYFSIQFTVSEQFNINANFQIKRGFTIDDGVSNEFTCNLLDFSSTVTHPWGNYNNVDVFIVVKQDLPNGQYLVPC